MSRLMSGGLGARTPDLGESLLGVLVLVPEAIAAASHALLSSDLAAAGDAASSFALVSQESRELSVSLVEGPLRAGMCEGALPVEVGRGALLAVLEVTARCEEAAGPLLEGPGEAVGERLWPRARGLLQRAAEAAARIWGLAADCLVEPAPGLLEDLCSAEDALADVVGRIGAEVATGASGVELGSLVMREARGFDLLGQLAATVTRCLALRPVGLHDLSRGLAPGPLAPLARS